MVIPVVVPASNISVRIGKHSRPGPRQIDPRCGPKGLSLGEMSHPHEGRTPIATRRMSDGEPIAELFIYVQNSKGMNEQTIQQYEKD